MDKGTICRECKSMSEEIKTIKSEIKIKDKMIVIEAQRRICTNCNQIKFDKVLDQKFSLLVIEEYNKKYGIRGEDIATLRNSFGISQETFGKVLGIAKKTIVSYENEKAIPNDSYFTLIKSLINDRKKIIDYADINKSSLSAFEIKKIYEGNDDLFLFSCDPFQLVIEEEPTPYNGYKIGDKEHILKVIQYIASKVKGKTRLAKTLFIADALSYSDTAKSLTGIQYAAINNGPIPNQFDLVLDYMIKAKKISLEIVEVQNYTQYNYHSEIDVELNEKEKYYIDLAIDFAKHRTASKLSELTHKLDIWNKAEIGEIMSFDLLDEFSLEDWK